MYTNNKLSKAVRLALVFGAAFSGATVAQEAANTEKAEDTKIEKIEVTGSRIQSANMISGSPVTTVSEEEFQFSGTTRVEDLLNTLPQLSPGFDSFSVNPSTGFATADLRGLGSNRTLVLVNGHRLQPGGIRSEARDLNQIPAALVKRVEVLTGGASAVYGSDAVAGVVNFILDTEFEGVSIDLGHSGYQHNNRNEYMRGLMDSRNFTYPTGNTGLDGRSTNVDLALGSTFDGGKGHAMAYVTWRGNDELRQSARDYSSCQLNNAGTACGGSQTGIIPSFLGTTRVVDANGNPIVQHVQNPDTGVWEPTGQISRQNWYNLNASNAWQAGPGPAYNFAPINHYQRPDKRYNFGASVKYEINEHFEPYLEMMATNTRTSVQIAESGTFFVNNLSLPCSSNLLGAFCTERRSLGDITYRNAAGQEIKAPGFIDPNQNVVFAVGKRNNEGGPRISEIESNSFRIVSGLRGFINDEWNYDISYLYGRNASSEVNINDFLASRTGDALLGCPTGSFDGCIPYNVWKFNGVTADAANALSGSGIRSGATDLKVLNAYVSGSIENFVPGVTSPISTVFGTEYRSESFATRVDTNMATGNFTGLGGPRNPIAGGFSLREMFFEGYVPVYEGEGVIQDVSLDLGYRISDYSTSGSVESYKLGFAAQITDMVRLRGGYNRAIRAANIGELFAEQSIGLFPGEDGCAGEKPKFTQAQCANTGLNAGLYGSVNPNPASQYNQFGGGNPKLNPEQADTYTIGLAATPFEDFDVSLDYYTIELTDRIGTIGAQTILDFCARLGDKNLCDRVNRSNGGDLWVGSDVRTSGYVENLSSNFGDLNRSGVDLNVTYRHDLWDGRMTYSFNGSYNLEYEVVPLPGISPQATYDCAGRINTSCQLPDWKHTARATYSFGDYSVSLKWRHTSAIDYINTDKTPGTTDRLLGPKGQLDAWNFFDLSGSAQLTDYLSLTVGVNNILDKEPPLVGDLLNSTGNAPSGYDQLGRFIFATASFRF